MAPNTVDDEDDEDEAAAAPQYRPVGGGEGDGE